jgi:hypothetical protein
MPRLEAAPREGRGGGGVARRAATHHDHRGVGAEAGKRLDRLGLAHGAPL